MKVILFWLALVSLGNVCFASDLRGEVIEKSSEFIRKYEWVRYVAYPDWAWHAIWFWTKSYAGETIDHEQAWTRFNKELERRVDKVMWENNLNVNQLSALVSLYYNCPSCYRSISRMTTKYNWLAHDKVCNGGVCTPIRWLTKRRTAERDMYNEWLIYNPAIDEWIKINDWYKKECTRVADVRVDQYVQVDSWLWIILNIFRPKEKSKVFICNNI